MLFSRHPCEILVHGYAVQSRVHDGGAGRINRRKAPMRILIAVGAVALLGACQMTEPRPSFQRTAPLPPGVDAPHSDQPVTDAGMTPPVVEPDVPTLPPSSDCGASQMQQYVGGPIPDPFPAGDNPMRIYRAGDPVTEDNDPNRLNIVLDASGARIVAITCG
jgi:hypothetical protein